MTLEIMKEFTCPACGRTNSDLPADHEMWNDTDAAGWPIMVCNYAVMRNEYRIECFGSGGEGEQIVP
jgi:hypothetical protein